MPPAKSETCKCWAKRIITEPQAKRTCVVVKFSTRFGGVVSQLSGTPPPPPDISPVSLTPDMSGWYEPRPHACSHTTRPPQPPAQPARPTTPSHMLPTPYSLHPTTSTLHLTPDTLLHTPYIPPLTSYTPHPTTYILHPTPHPLHPTPYTPHLAPSTLHTIQYP